MMTNGGDDGGSTQSPRACFSLVVASTSTTSRSNAVSLKAFLIALVVSNLLVIQLCHLQLVSLDHRSSTASSSSSSSFSAWLPSSLLKELLSLPSGRDVGEDSAQVGRDGNPHRMNAYRDGDVFRLARKQSLGFFPDITNSDWKGYIQQTTSSPPYRFPNEPNFRSHDVPFWTFFNWDPTFTCPHLLRLQVGDSRKFICDPERIIVESSQSVGSTRSTDGL